MSLLLATSTASGQGAPPACPLATAADFAAYPSTLRTIQPETLFTAGTPTKCPGGTNATPCGGHRVYVPAVTNPNRTPRRDSQFFIFLGGTGSTPDNYDQMLVMAAYAGYRTIGLSYDDTTRIETACATDCDCYGPARTEVINGVNSSPALTVLRGDSIVDRLYRLAKYLDRTYPGEGWDQLTSRDDHDGVIEFTDIDWDSIVLSGHSQGAGNALRISKEDALDGILVFDGGQDNCASGGRTYATWADLPDFGVPRRSFDHDRAGTFAVPASLIAMEFGLTSADFAVLDTTWPTSMLVATTNQTPPPGCSEHESMANDGCFPEDLTGGFAATSVPDAYVFPFYVRWMCEVGN